MHVDWQSFASKSKKQALQVRNKPPCPSSQTVGLLVPDLPLELTHEIRAACEKEGIELVLLVTPTSPKARMREIAKHSQGFVYLVSVTGVTGARASISERVKGLIQTLHETTHKSVRSGPKSHFRVSVQIAVGFGVSSGEQAKQLQDWGADGVIVGSALVKSLHVHSSLHSGKHLTAL